VRINRLDHKQKALIATIIIEVILIFLLFNITFPERPVEDELTINFIEEDFDFEQLKTEKTEIPDISEYLNRSDLSSLASNEWQEELSESEENDFDETGEEESEQENPKPVFEELSGKTPGFDFNEKNDTKKTAQKQLGKSFKGQSSIKYYITGRYKTKIINPVYTCPGFMHGVVRIRIEVDRNGKVTKAEFDPKHSTAHFGCLIDTAIKYSLKARFNKDPDAPERQTGYIEYIF
jgi:hypothetical protein